MSIWESKSVAVRGLLLHQSYSDFVVGDESTYQRSRLHIPKTAILLCI